MKYRVVKRTDHHGIAKFYVQNKFLWMWVDRDEDYYGYVHPYDTIDDAVESIKAPPTKDEVVYTH